jgi:hypothetical protein
MDSGYVLGFSDRTFQEFVQDSVERDIYDPRYNYASGSKANRLRGFWLAESNPIIAKLMTDLIDHVCSFDSIREGKADLIVECKRIATRLMQDVVVQEAGAFSAVNEERNFEVIAKAIQNAIEQNELEAGLDRLHTFVVMFVRSLCQNIGIAVDREKALHSLFGEYVKRLKSLGCIESAMTERILKGSISVLEAFNEVRNTRSLAHDNPLLNYDEALLIFNHVSSSVRFLRNTESRVHKN